MGNASRISAAAATGRVVSVTSSDGLNLYIGLPPAADGDKEHIRPIKLGDAPPIVLENESVCLILLPDEAHALGVSLIAAASEATTQGQLATFFIKAMEMTPGGVRKMMEAFARHRYQQGSVQRGTEPESATSSKSLFNDSLDIETVTGEAGERSNQ